MQLGRQNPRIRQEKTRGAVGRAEPSRTGTFPTAERSRAVPSPGKGFRV